MGKKLRVLFDNNKIWLFLCLHVLVALLLFLFALLVDTRTLALIDYLPRWMVTSVDLAKSILSTLAGALLTITTFTFSTTMAVLSTYSSNYSPRVVENFLAEKSTMKVLGVFIGGFVYCILSLFCMRNVFADYSVFSAGIAILYSLYCVVEFVIFIFSVAKAVQISNLIYKLEQEAEQTIAAFTKSHADLRTLPEDTLGGYTESIAITSGSYGYLQIIDSEALAAALDGLAYRLVVGVRVGDYVCRGMELAMLYSREHSVSDEILDAVQKGFGLEQRRYAFEDYRFAIQKIVEVALRALSPGINDPGTAVNCIQVLGDLFSSLAGLDGCYLVSESDDTQSQIIVEQYNFEKDLYAAFVQIIHYGKQDILVVNALLRALYAIKLASTDTNAKHVATMAQYVRDSCWPNFTQRIDVDALEQSLSIILS